MSMALSSDSDRPPSDLSAYFSQLLMAQGSSPVFDFFLASDLSVSLSFRCFLALALKPMLDPPIYAYSILGSHCFDASPS